MFIGLVKKAKKIKIKIEINKKAGPVITVITSVGV